VGQIEWGNFTTYQISNFRNYVRSPISITKRPNKQTKKHPISLIISPIFSEKTSPKLEIPRQNSGRGAPPRSLRVHGIGSVDGIVGLPVVELVQHGVMGTGAFGKKSFHCLSVFI